MEPHKHAEVIKAWADGAKVEVFSLDDKGWVEVPSPFFWNPDHNYRVKPEPPAKVYPVTGMTELELREAAQWHYVSPKVQLSDVANAALRHAIDSGQLVSADHEVVVMGRTSRAARDMAIANAVMNSVNKHGWHADTELADLIASVKG